MSSKNDRTRESRPSDRTLALLGEYALCHIWFTLEKVVLREKASTDVILVHNAHSF